MSQHVAGSIENNETGSHQIAPRTGPDNQGYQPNIPEVAGLLTALALLVAAAARFLGEARRWRKPV